MNLRSAERTVLRLTARLAAKREEAGLSQRQVARLAGLDPKTISLIERGKRSPTLLTLLMVSGALGIDLCEILAQLRPNE